MGSRPAPSYANLFMAKKIDEKIIELANSLENETDPISFFKRFLDDIFLIYTGTIENLHLFLSELNNIHQTIKFTMSHTTPSSQMGNPVCECEINANIPFLDTSCEIVNGKIITDLYRNRQKPIPVDQFMSPGPCH